MRITRRNALMGATAAAVVTGAITAPIAIKAAGVRAALGGEPLVAMEQEWHTFLNYIHNYPDESDAALDPLYARLTEIEEQIYATPARTPQGVAVKLRLWGSYYADFSGDHRWKELWWRGDLAGMDIAQTGFGYVMRDLERLSGEVTS